MKKIILIIFSFLITTSALAQQGVQMVDVWHPELGNIESPTPGTDIKVSYKAQSIEIMTDSSPQNISGRELEAELNRQLAAAEIGWARISLKREFFLTVTLDSYPAWSLGGYRRVRIGVGNNAIWIYQYTNRDHIPITSYEVVPGERKDIRVENTIDRNYTLLHNNTILQTQTGTRMGTVIFKDVSMLPGTYVVSGVEAWPITATAIPLFSTRLRSTSPYSQTIDKDGGRIQLDLYTPASERSLLSEFQKAAAIYNAGESTTWGTQMQLEVQDGGIRANNHYYHLFITSGPNLSDSSITCDSGLGEPLGQKYTFTQAAGGSLYIPVTFSIENIQGKKLVANIPLSQYLVTYKLLYNKNVVDSATGKGGNLVLRSTDCDDGYYQVICEYQGQIVPMQNTSIVAEQIVEWRGWSNWISTSTYTDSDKFVTDINYYDGLGSIIQQVQVAASPNEHKDIATPFYYDEKRRESQVYLPYVVNRKTGGYNFMSYDRHIRYHRDLAYSHTYYDNSPLDRVTGSYQTGTVFSSANKATRFSYDVCDENEVLWLDIAHNDSLVVSGFYPQSSLYKNTVTDEDGAVTITFTDMQERTILIRAKADGENADTYYVYDLSGRLAWIISPEGSIRLEDGEDYSPNSVFAGDYCYTYKYDGRGNLVEKQIPGSGPEYMVYDSGDMLVYKQTPLLRKEHKWLQYDYDYRKRLTSEVIGVLNITRDQFQARVDAKQNITLAGRIMIYSNVHDGIYEGCPYYRSVYGVTTTDDGEDLWVEAQGEEKLTVEQIRTIDGNGWLSRGYYYDRKGRVIQVAEEYPDGGVLYTSTKYDFTDKAVEVYQEYMNGESILNYWYTSYTYDDRGRLLREYTVLDDNASADIFYGYDELGRLVTRSYGDPEAMAQVSVNDSYWLKVDKSKQLKTNWSIQDIMVYGSSSNYTDYDIYDFVLTDNDLINPKYFICTDPSKSWIEYYYIPQMGKLNQEIISWAISMYSDFTWDKSPKIEVVSIPFPGQGVKRSEVDVYRKDSRVITETISYNLQGWRTDQHVVKGADTLYRSNLYYYNPQKPESEPRYTGNISEWQWKHGDDLVGQTSVQYPEYCYIIGYDQLGRVLGTPLYQDETMTLSNTEAIIEYDLNGNPIDVVRTSLDDFSFAFSYNYAGNKLLSIENQLEMEDPITYTYDSAGNMVTDGLNNLDLTYNHLNLINNVKQNNAVLANYSYLSDGTKLSTLDGAGKGLLYRGSFVYSKTGSGLTLESASFSGGRFIGNNEGMGLLHYHITDHLGSVRVVVDQDGEVLERNNYYPFGKRWEEDAMISDNRYRFNGKEDQSFVGSPYVDYGARQYDPNLIIWRGVDAMAEVNPGISPFAFSNNNPVRFIDPNGMWVEDGDWVTTSDPDEIAELLNSVMRKATRTAMHYAMRALGQGAVNYLDDKAENGNVAASSLAMTTEFILGIGERERNFKEGHAMTESLKNSHMTKVALAKFWAAYSQGRTPRHYQVEWGPFSETGVIREWIYDGGFSAPQFTGTATYYFEIDGSNLKILVRDDKNTRSALYHLPGLSSHSREENRFMGTTYQTYEFSVPLSAIPTIISK